MANERKTESIVRTHFKKFSDILHIEEQASDNLKIAKLLKTASKKGEGQGKPEFLITFKTNSDLLIVIECKADITKHESANHDKFADYAVDGVLLYASHLCKDFDVLAIAVSGETTQSLKISHFLQLKNERKAVPIFSDTLLTAQNYLDGYIGSPEKVRQDYDSLLTFTKTLNEQLHSNKILESQRSLLISCILIALENPAFKASYNSQRTPRDLAKNLVDTVANELDSANIGDVKLSNLKNQFSFIQTDMSLSTKEGLLKELIDSIDTNINSFIKNHQYIDVLGQLYIEFLRYANSDKGLGIVLTPPHITEFFAEVAQVNKNSIVYDNCTGTGGFLISAMKQMISDAKGNESIIKNIKANQLIGVEYQSHIFALAVSNMYIHGDGKTGIFNGSCFDKDIVAAVEAKNPTIGFLNPPYKSNKKTDTDELEFILNNLECLSDGGTCVAIVPMQSALAQKGKVFEYKNKLLEKHTLEAVFSMPDELFFNSNVNVVTCVMVFTAHKKHPATKKTFFGYFKKDGFEKRKNLGRIDIYGEWKEIKEEWKTTFSNKDNVAGLSVMKHVTAKDEWCAEAYMETDYSVLSNADFIETLLFYSSYIYLNKLSFAVSNASIINQNVKLENENWAFFNLTDIFSITGSKTTPVLELNEFGIGKYPYVTTKATNNGVDGFYDYATEKGGVLTLDSAVVGYCSYQEYNFSASDHVEKLIPKFEMNKYSALFLVTVINKEQYRFSYGRKCSQSRLKQLKIKLPTKDNLPDWEFMENYIKSLPYSQSV